MKNVLQENFSNYYIIDVLCLQYLWTRICYRKIFNKKNNDIIVYATVHNLTRSKFNVSDAGGNYKIVAALNDTLIFSSAGYFPDTIIVNATMTSLPYDMLMAQRVVVLPTAIIDETNKRS